MAELAAGRGMRVVDAALWFLDVRMRVPLKFGPETLTSVTCARVQLTVRDETGKTATGWGETPLSVQWVWPSAQAYEPRHQALKQFCQQLATAWANFANAGHPLEVGYAFQRDVLPGEMERFNQEHFSQDSDQAMPYLAGLVCCSLYDIALHDAYGQLVGKPIYETYNASYMSSDLSQMLSQIFISSAVVVCGYSYGS